MNITMESINKSNCNNVIKGVCVSNGSSFMNVTTNQHVDNNSVNDFADELAQIRVILPTHEDIDRLHHAMTELELALRKNDTKTFREGVTKYMKVLSIPIFVRIATPPLVNAIRAIFPNIY